MQSSTPPPHPLWPSDLRALAQLGTEATVGVSRIAEGVHRSVLGTMGFSDAPSIGRTRGLTGLVYRTIRGVTSFVGQGVDVAMSGVQRVVGSSTEPEQETTERAAVLAVLNGVLGDHLIARGNALATPMTFRHCGRIVTGEDGPVVESATGKIVLLVHGLCMNDLQWHTAQNGKSVDHGATLSAIGYTPIYLRYNTGLHSSVNGRELATQMARLVEGWPVPVEEVVMVAHSMGGLVTRSAIHYAQQAGLDWTALLRHMIFLGTPHHGAPLEKVGNWVDDLLARSTFTAPFGVLPRLRGAGITDLRHGHVIDEDWQGRDRFERVPDARRILPLPEGVACHAIGATTAAAPRAVVDRIVGDGLVSLDSALGEHRDVRRRLSFRPDSTWVARSTSHLQLLSRPEVGQQMVRWLSCAEERSTR